MVMVANLQLGWTPFVDPIDQKYHWGRYAIQWAFTIFVLTQTWLVPLHGYLVDRFGPRVMNSARAFSSARRGSSIPMPTRYSCFMLGL
jgi:MFS family permease